MKVTDQSTKNALARGEQDAKDFREQQLRDRKIWAALSPMQREVLAQLVERGPVWDGDICSKQARGELFAFGLASRAIVKGLSGYSVANYRGFDVYGAREE